MEHAQSWAFYHPVADKTTRVVLAVKEGDRPSPATKDQRWSGKLDVPGGCGHYCCPLQWGGSLGSTLVAPKGNVADSKAQTFDTAREATQTNNVGVGLGDYSETLGGEGWSRK